MRKPLFTWESSRRRFKAFSRDFQANVSSVQNVTMVKLDCMKKGLGDVSPGKDIIAI